MLQQSGYVWVLVGGVLAWLMLCYGVYALIRLRAAPQWIFFAMTLYLTFELLVEPAGNSPFHSRQRIYLNRPVLLVPLIAGCIYLLRPGFRTACRELRSTTHANAK